MGDDKILNVLRFVYGGVSFVLLITIGYALIDKAWQAIAAARETPIDTSLVIGFAVLFMIGGVLFTWLDGRGK